MKEAKKINMELGGKEGGKNIGPKINREAVDAWLSKFPKNEGGDLSLKVNRLKNEAPASVKEAKVAEALKMAEDSYPPQPEKVAPEPVITIENTKTEDKKENKFLAGIKKLFGGRNTKKAVISGLALGSALSAQGQNINQQADQAFVKNSNAKEYKIGGNETKPEARKVSKVPEGYTPDGKEGTREYYKKVTSNQNGVEMAVSGGPQGDNSKFLIEKLGQGVTPDELVAKGHATKEGIKKFEKYYKPSSSVDRVYIEPSKEIKKADPYAAFAISGEGVYLPGVSGPNAGQMYYLSMGSKNAWESGMTNTSLEPCVVRLENPNGKYIDTTVKLYSIEDRNKYFDISGRHLLPGAFEALKKVAEEQMKEVNNSSEEKIQQLGADYTTKADTVKLPGSNIEGK